MFTKEEILAETKKIQYLYGLKHEIRYAETRDSQTESVAEHIYAMHILAHYFLALEDVEKTWNRQRIFEMITWHDIDELETGDIIGYKKTDADRIAENNAIETVLNRMPTALVESLTPILLEYQKRETIESQFVKALDKIETLFELFNERGKALQQKNKTSIENYKSIKDVYIAPFLTMRRFNEVLSEEMIQQGFFTHDA